MALTCPFMNNIYAGDIRYLWFLGGLLRARLFHSTLRRLKFLIAVPETGFAVTAWGVAVWSLPSPPSTSLNCMQRETLAIAPRSERHVCGFFATAVCARAFKARLLSLRQKIPFRARVSQTDSLSCVGSMQFGPDSLHQAHSGIVQNTRHSQ
jgi:hypothetical protein